MRPFNIIFSFLLCTSLSAAWPWPPSFRDLHDALVPRKLESPFSIRERAAKTSAASSSAANTGAAASSTAAPASKSAAAATAKETGKGTASASKSAAKTSGTQTGNTSDNTASASGTSTSSSVSIDPAAGAGAISLISPAANSQTYIKIGDVVTFVWNYTSVIVSPSRINVVASNTDGAWTITSNMTVKETGSVTWNTSDQATSLPMEKYTFVVYDSEAGVTGAVKPGYLSPYQNYQFAMYSPLPPVDENDFFCVTCNGAMTTMARQSMKVLFGTALITVLSFTWFACGFLGL